MKEVEPMPPHWIERNTDKEKIRALLHPQIFIGRCSYCGFCVESCKFNALYHTPGFDAATHHKEDLHYSYNDLYRVYQLYYPEEYKKSLKEYEEKYGKKEQEKEEDSPCPAAIVRHVGSLPPDRSRTVKLAVEAGDS